MTYDSTDTPNAPALSEPLKQVMQGQLCSGCGGCALVAPDKITMRSVAPGYLRPVQHTDLEPQERLIISAICPGLGQTVDPGTRTDDALWGPYLGMYTGHATDPDIRHKASSGGALSAILVHLLESGQVDKIIQTGADPALPTGNMPVLAESVETITQCAGSRYAPSAPLDGLARLLDSQERFAFVGKPCDVAALRALSRLDARIDARIPVMVSFFCAGIPSLSGSDAVLQALGTDRAGTTAFRYRGHGWPGRATATLSNGGEASMTYNDSWGKILSRHVQHRCKICADGTGTAADLVCADAWECDAEGYPVFEEQDGISLIVTRTQKGAALLSEATAAGRVAHQPFDVALLANIQPGQRERRRALLARLAGLWLLRKPIPKYRGLHLGTVARQNPLARNAKNFLGMVRRGLTGKI